MKRILMPALLVLSLACFGAFAATKPTAAPKKPAAMTMHRTSGTIVSTSENSLVIKTKKGKEMTFTMNDKTAKPAELKAGEMVQVQYMSENGSNTAERITASAAHAKSKSKNK